VRVRRKNGAQCARVSVPETQRTVRRSTGRWACTRRRSQLWWGLRARRRRLGRGRDRGESGALHGEQAARQQQPEIVSRPHVGADGGAMSAHGACSRQTGGGVAVRARLIAVTRRGRRVVAVRLSFAGSMYHRSVRGRPCIAGHWTGHGLAGNAKRHHQELRDNADETTEAAHESKITRSSRTTHHAS
jgi:hypothetical protein